MINRAFVLTMALMLVPAAAQAGTYWVSPGGAASWASCESATPLDGAAACSLATANANAAAGDTVTLRAGTYVGGEIRPAQSGTSDAERIVYESHGDEQVVLQESAYGIYIYKQSYITVDGIDIVDARRFMRIYAGHYNIISHCDFDQRSPESGDWAGAIIADDMNDDTDSSENSTHNWVHHCSFFRWVYGAFDEHRGALLNIGNDQAAGDDSAYNLVEDNTFAYGGHHTLGVYANYNVIRNNYIHNETNPDGWDFEGYRGAITEGPSAGRCLYEGNRFGFSGASGMALRSRENIFRFNTFYHNGSGAIQTVSNQAGIDYADYNYIYHNTFYHNGHLADYSGFQGGMYFSSWSGQSPVGNVVKNNIFHDNMNGSVSYDGTVEPQTIESNWDEEGAPLFVDVTTAVDPMIYPPALPDLHLQEDSPCVDRGSFLTAVASADDTGTSFQVEDPAYFMDGWGIVEADRIQLEGQSESVSVTAIDYDTATITVDGELSWTRGQGVGLAYAGAAPDLGAYEYGVSSLCSEQGGECCSASERCTGGEYAEALDCGSRCCVSGSCEAVPGAGGRGQAGSGPGAAPDEGNGESDGGCGCRLASPTSRSGMVAFGIWLLGVALLGWQRRRRPGNSRLRRAR